MRSTAYELAAPNVATDPDAGPLLGRYELLMRVASGGMATVWAARLRGSRGFQKIVALKTILPHFCANAKYEKMFLDEATYAGQIRHPNVAQILDLGEDNGVLFLAMEWIDGVTKLVDFGIAKLTGDGPDDTTRSSMVQGKVAYLAPEQIQATTVDRRADIFALGIILYILTTGTHPFNGRTASATLYKISCPDQVTPPSALVPDYPSELEATVLRCLEKDPSRRFATADELVWALESSIPADLRATDQDVSVLVRSLAGDLGARRLRALLSANADATGVSMPNAPNGAPFRSPLPSRASETRPNDRRAYRQVVAPASKGSFRPVLLFAALVGSVGALTVESAFRAMASSPATPGPSSVAAQMLVAPREPLAPLAPREPPSQRFELMARISAKPALSRGPGRWKSSGTGHRVHPMPATVRAARPAIVLQDLATAKEVEFGDVQ